MKGKANEPVVLSEPAVTLDIELRIAKGVLPKFDYPVRMSGNVRLDPQAGESIQEMFNRAFQEAWASMRIEVPQPLRVVEVKTKPKAKRKKKPTPAAMSPRRE